MFQVSTFDDWGDIAREHFDENGSMRPLPTFFFMTFLLIVSFTLLPVVVAVLLGSCVCDGGRWRQGGMGRMEGKGGREGSREGRAIGWMEGAR